jgi:hypothetical protein
VGEIFLAAVAADKARTVIADRELRDEDQQLLPLGEDLLAE